MDVLGLLRPTKAVGADELRALLERGDRGGITLVDVREPAEYAGGHIPGAVHVPLSRLAERVGELDRSKPVVTY